VQAILRDIGAILGVMGSFICANGGVLARSMPPAFTDAALASVSRVLGQTSGGPEA
jgi:hypothetical protein